MLICKKEKDDVYLQTLISEEELDRANSSIEHSINNLEI